MRIQLIAKRESGMTGTLRYASDLYQGLKAIGLHTDLTFPNRAVLPTVIGDSLKNARIDLETFFANFPLRAKPSGADIYHLTGQMLATLLLFQRFPGPVVVSVLDIIPYLVRNQPEMNTLRHPVDKVFYRLALAGLRRADVLVAISNYTRRTLIEALRLPADRIEVVYPGVDLDKFRTMTVPATFLSKYGLNENKRYILFVGSEDPRKNLATLLLAFARVKQYMPDVKLLKVGSAHFEQERRNLENLVANLRLQNEVLFCNYVPDEDLPYFYNTAACLVMPSFFEGFGLPVVEAMACGTPVVSSQAGSLPEVSGQAGRYVDPNEPHKMAETLLTLLDNPREMLWMRQAGKEQASKFALDKVAVDTQRIYAQLLANTHRQVRIRPSYLTSKTSSGFSKGNNMNIALVVPSYPSEHCGVSTYSNYLARELSNLAYVEVITRSSPSNLRSIIQQVEKAAKHFDVIHVQHAFDLYGYMGYLTIPLYQRLQHSGKPVVTTLHEIPEMKSRALKARLALFYLKSCIRKVVRGSDVVLVHTEATMNLLREWHFLKGIQFVPHGMIRQTSFLPNSLPKSPFTIGFFGFITENKGVHRLLDALIELPGVRLLIAGEPRTERDQKYLARLRRQVVELNLENRVEFLGFLPDNRMSKFFQSIDLMVFPYSLCTASGALHLALAHGSVVLTSNLPVFHELRVRYGCLEEFELNNANTLRDQMKRLLSDASRRAALIAGGQRMMADTSWEAVAKKTYAVYQELISDDLPTANAFPVPG